MQTEAQKFMNQHGITKCYECDGQLYKHEANAKIRQASSGKPITVHEASAGPATVKTEEPEQSNN